MPTLSLVLATYGRAEPLQQLIQSLVTQTSSDFELIVVDQNHDERVVPYIEQAQRSGISAVHVRMAQPNLSAARNLGTQRANGNFIAFPDDDCWYEPQVVEAVLAALASHADWHGVMAQWVEQSQAHGGQPAAPLLSNANWRRYRDGDASSISLFIKADLLRQLGGFDVRLGVGQWFGAGEETDLILAALAAGARLARCPTARVHHRFVGQTQAQAVMSWQSALRRSRGTGALYIKHRLAPAVILRGLLAPPVKALWPWRGGHALGLALATSAGRLQGALAWLLGRHS